MVVGTSAYGVLAKCQALPRELLSLFSHSVVSDIFVTPWTGTRQAPLSMGFSRQEYWSGLPMRSSRGSSRPSDRTTLFISPALAGRFFTFSATWYSI